MILSSETKQAIKKEYEDFKESMYAGKSKEERDELAQFFTPPEISIKLIEELSDLSGNILDPTCGSGNLLAAALIAGADSQCIFGNDYDKTMVDECRKRLNNICKQLGKPELKHYQIHRGNALQARCLTDFSTTYDQNYRIKYIDDLRYAQGDKTWDDDNSDMNSEYANREKKQAAGDEWRAQTETYKEEALFNF